MNLDLSPLGFRKTPFTRELDVTERFTVPHQDEAIEALAQAVHQRRSAALVAPAGSGKTVALRILRSPVPERKGARCPLQSYAPPFPNGSAIRSPSPVPSVPHQGRTRNGTPLSYLRHSVPARLQPPASPGAKRNSQGAPLGDLRPLPRSIMLTAIRCGSACPSEGT